MKSPFYLMTLISTSLIAATPSEHSNTEPFNSPVAATAAEVTADLTGLATAQTPEEKRQAIDAIINTAFNFFMNRTITQADLAKKTGLSVAEVAGYQQHIKKLVADLAKGTVDYAEEEAFAKKLLAICIKTGTNKLDSRLVASGVSPDTIQVWKSVGYLVEQATSKALVANGCCSESTAKTISDLFGVVFAPAT